MRKSPSTCLGWKTAVWMAMEEPATGEAEVRTWKEAERQESGRTHGDSDEEGRREGDGVLQHSNQTRRAVSFVRSFVRFVRLSSGLPSLHQVEKRNNHESRDVLGSVLNGRRS